MEQPLPDFLGSDSPPTEPRLRLLTDVDETDADDNEPVDEAISEEEDDAGEADDEPRAASRPEPTQDPLKLYVRAIGDGPLLTAAEERELARRKDAGDEEAS